MISFDWLIIWFDLLKLASSTLNRVKLFFELLVQEKRNATAVANRKELPVNFDMPDIISDGFRENEKSSDLLCGCGVLENL
jgi:hypothetical protein